MTNINYAYINTVQLLYSLTETGSPCKAVETIENKLKTSFI